ncbi:MAG: FG-GAP repeat domain-containing protein [Planctomycetota bacterium]
MNEDGKTDLVVQTDNYVFYLKQQENTDDWKVNKINKPEITHWVTRPTKVVDIDGNGKLDIVGMTIHNYGYTPLGKASVFRMEYLGGKPGTDNWETHVIKWSDGIFSGRPFRGEKWDHMRFIDLDGNGDLDIIANCEEYYEKINGKQKTLLGVVWFENPTINP